MTTENYVKHSSLLNLLGGVGIILYLGGNVFCRISKSMGVKGQGILPPNKVSLGFDA